MEYKIIGISRDCDVIVLDLKLESRESGFCRLSIPYSEHNKNQYQIDDIVDIEVKKYA